MKVKKMKRVLNMGLKTYKFGFKHGRTFTKKVDPAFNVFLAASGTGGLGYGAGVISTRGKRKREQEAAFSIGFEMGKQVGKKK